MDNSMEALTFWYVEGARPWPSYPVADLSLDSYGIVS